MDPISSRVLLGAAGAGGDNYWITQVGGSNTDYLYDVRVDSSGNVYAAGQHFTNASNAGGILMQLDADGAVQWSRLLDTTGTSYQEAYYQLGLDSSGDIYVGGFSSSYTGRRHVAAKYNSSGTIQWQRLYGSNSYTTYAYGLAVDSSGGVYGCAGANNAGDLRHTIFKWSSTGNFQWQRRIGTSGNQIPYRLATDSSNNVYMIGYAYNAGIGGQDWYMTKWSTSGVLQWQRAWGGSSADVGKAVAVDSSGNVYFVGQSESTGVGYTDTILVKCNSSGTIQWQRGIGSSGYYMFAEGITTDSSGNVYIIAQQGNSSDALIVKWDSSGNIQWQRELDGPGWTTGYGITADNAGSIYVVGSSDFSSTGSGGYEGYVAKLPDDGSLTGTYGNWDYAASSYTTFTPSQTFTATSFSSASNNSASSTGSLTDYAPSISSTVTNL